MLCLASFFSAYSNAQTVDPVTGNLINSNGWHGVTYGTHPGDCCTGGPQPLYDTSNNSINFSYGNYNVANLVDFYSNPTLNQPGVKIIGYNYSWTIKSESQNGLDPVNASIGLYAPTGSYIEGFNYPNMYSGTYSGSQNFTRPYGISEARYLQLNFQAVDSGFWAGYYGPQVSNISLAARYTVDPCVANPLYASHCPGFNDIVLSGNLVPNPTGGASWGSGINQTFAIATALQHGGMGVKVHGINYGFDAYVGDTYYAGAFWTDWRDPNLYVNVNVRDAAGNSIYSANRKSEFDDKPYWQTYNYSYVLPQTRNSLTLGNFEFTAQTQDAALITNMYARINYTPDQCVLNPLFSTSCTGYQQAYFDQQCNLNPLYSNACPGYAQAYYDQQCSVNSLYDSGCPGYAAAYFNQQCSLNGLYDKLCPGYQAAFLAAQCEINQLYSTQCPGYTQAKLLKDLQDQQAAQTQAASEPTSSSTTSNVSSSPTATTSSPTVALADPTRTETVVTTDVGGVELTTSGQISVPTGQPTATKEAIKESAKAEETKTETKETEKKRVDPRALAVAMAAVAATEKTALATAEQAVSMSQASVGPNDGTGVTLGSGITLQSNRSQGLTDEKNDDKKDQGKSTSTQRGSGPTDNINLLAAPPQPAQESNQKAGPAVRRGGTVEGMEGGPDPAALARAPLDFNQYLNSQLKDAQFYSSKEIYKGQRTVDNARAQRFLNGASDVLHQRMVEQQYQIGQ